MSSESTNRRTVTSDSRASAPTSRERLVLRLWKAAPTVFGLGFVAVYAAWFIYWYSIGRARFLTAAALSIAAHIAIGLAWQTWGRRCPRCKNLVASWEETPASCQKCELPLLNHNGGTRRSSEISFPGTQVSRVRFRAQVATGCAAGRALCCCSYNGVTRKP